MESGIGPRRFGRFPSIRTPRAERLLISGGIYGADDVVDGAVAVAKDGEDGDPAGGVAINAFPVGAAVSGEEGGVAEGMFDEEKRVLVPFVVGCGCCRGNWREEVHYQYES